MKPDTRPTDLLTYHVGEATQLHVTVAPAALSEYIVKGIATWPDRGLPVPLHIVLIGDRPVVVADIARIEEASTSAVLWQR
jgi:hypothetical protein